MKIIISHDVDHLTASEHFKDSLIPKFIIRNTIELILKKITFTEYGRRFNSIITNKWNNISELIDYNKKHNIPATFFIGVNNGIGLNYNLNLSSKWIKEIIARGVDCGVHGIAYNNFNDVKEEYKTFQQLSGLKEFGIRMHYLRNDEKTFDNLSKCGYIFDSTEYGINKHHKISEMHEFPLHIMESYELEAGKKWQSKTTQEAVETAIGKIKEAEEKGIEYLTILFHDRYFDHSFQSWKNWYIDITNYCKAQGYEFVNYKQAILNINK